MTDTEALKALVADWRDPTICHPLGPMGSARNACANELERVLERMLASQTQDMVLVPREPTPEMCLAAHNAPERGHPETASQSYADIWSAMLAAAPVASQMGEPDVALNEEARVTLKIMVEALMYGEAALNAAQTKMTQTGDLKGAGLMQPALDKIRAALKAEKTAAPAAGMDADSSPPLAEPDVEENQGAESAADEIYRRFIEHGVGASTTSIRDLVASIIRRHSVRRPQEAPSAAEGGE